MRVVYAVSLLTMAAAGAGCLPVLDFKWQAIERFAHPSADSKAPAVVLYRGDRRVIHIARSESYNLYQRHEVIEVLGEAGLKYSSVRVPFSKEGKLVELQARTLSPEGAITPVDARKILETDARIAGDDEEDRRFQFRIFRFPDVRPGSRLEYAYTIETPTPIDSLIGHVAGELPIEQYRLEIITSSDVDAVVRSYNTKPFSREVEDGATHWRLTINHVAADTDEPWSGPDVLEDPWWMMRVDRVRLGDRDFPFADTWANAMRGTARRLYLKDTLLEGFAGHSPGGIAPRSIVTETLAEVHRRVARGRHGSLATMRPIKDVVAAGTGSDFEKTYYLRTQLDRAGVKAQFALATRNVPGAVDKDFPSPLPFNQLLVYVPAQPSIEAPLWIDAGCEHCLAGQIPPALQGTDALLFEVQDKSDEALKFSTNFAAVRGASPIASTHTRTYRARLDENGDLAVEAREEATGEESLARSQHLRRWTPAEREEDARRFVTERFPSGKLDAAVRDECDSAAGRCTRDLRFHLPACATGDGQRLLLPLVVFHSNWDRYLKDPRRKGLLASDAVRIVEELELRVPAGWTLDESAGDKTSTSAVVDTGSAIAVRDEAGGQVVTVTRTAQRHVGRFGVGEASSAARALREFEAVRNRVLVFRKAATAGGPAQAPPGR